MVRCDLHLTRSTLAHTLTCWQSDNSCVEGLIVVHAVLSSTIDYSILENDSASENCATMMLHSFSILRGSVSCLITYFHRICLKGSRDTTFELFVTHEMAPSSVEMRTVTSTAPFPLPNSLLLSIQERLVRKKLSRTSSIYVVPTLYSPKLTAAGLSRSAQTAFGHSRLLKTWPMAGCLGTR